MRHDAGRRITVARNDATYCHVVYPEFNYRQYRIRAYVLHYCHTRTDLIHFVMIRGFGIHLPKDTWNIQVICTTSSLHIYVHS